MSIHRMRHESKSNRLLWVVALLLVLGAAVGYFKLHPEDIPQWAARTSLGRDLQTTTVYKWQDATGAWHVGDAPPPPGIDFQSQTYTRDSNVLPLPPQLQR